MALVDEIVARARAEVERGLSTARPPSLIDEIVERARTEVAPSLGRTPERVIETTRRGDTFEAIAEDEALGEVMDEVGIGRRVLATGARIVGPVAGAFAGGAVGGPVGAAVGGAGGATLGETIAQQIERPREPLSLLPIAGEAALGAVPLGRLAGPLARGAGRFLGARGASIVGTGLEAAGFGAGAVGVQAATREGRPPTAQELGFGAVTGGILGGALGVIRFRPGSPIAKIVEQPGVPSEDVAEAVTRDVAAREAARAARGMTEIIAPATIKEFSDAVLELPLEVRRNAPSLIAALRSNRVIGDFINDLVQQGRLRPLDTPDGAADFGQLMRETSSKFGLGLNRIAQMNEIADTILGEQQKQTRGATSRYLFDIRRAMVVKTLGTQMVNAVTSAQRIGLTSIGRIASGLFDPRSPVIGLELARSLIQPRRAIRMTQPILEAFPNLKDKLLRFGAGETDIDPAFVRYARAANLWLDRIAERGPRIITLHAFAKEQLGRRGLDYEAFRRAPLAFRQALDKEAKSVLDDAMGEAIQLSRSMAFSENATGVISERFNKLVNDFPLLTLEFPFPRFMASAANFLINFSPLGMARLFAPRIAQDPTRTAEQLGQLVVGTGMLSMALALRMNEETRGEKFYELRIPGISAAIDLRRFSPVLAPHMFLADLLIAADEGKSLGAMDVVDVAEGLLGIQRIEGFATGLTGLVRRGVSVDTGLQQGLRIAGDILGSFFVPLRTLKDIFNDQRSVDRQANNMTRAFGSTLGNIPFAAEFLDLPEIVKPTTGEPTTAREPVDVFGVQIPAGVLRQLGVSTIEKDEVERALNELGIELFGPGGIAPGTDVARETPLRSEARVIARVLDQRIAQIMGPTVAAVASRQIQVPAFRALMQGDPEQAAIILRVLIGDIRGAARAQAEAELAIQNQRDFRVLQATRPGGGLSGLARRRAFEGMLGR